MKKHFKFKKLKNSTYSVSEVVGTILLFGIVVIIFSALYLIVLSEDYESEDIDPIIVGSIEGKNIVFTHQGGGSLAKTSKIQIRVGDETFSKVVGDILVDSNNDGLWSVGEKLTFEDFHFSMDLSEADVLSVNEDGSEALLLGSLDIHPTGDIAVKISISNENPAIGDQVTFSISLNYYRGDIDAENIQVKFKLPDGFTFNFDDSGGSYDDVTGIWTIDSLSVYDTFTLNVNATVTSLEFITEPTQLIMVVDGSGSIYGPDSNVQTSPDFWGMILSGIAGSVNDSIPHDGSVELSVVQFANTKATLDLDPIIVTDTNYPDIVNDILAIQQRAYSTPMACGFIKSADVLLASDNNPYNNGNFDRQVAIMVTDGQPTKCCNVNDSDPYYRDYDCVETSYQNSAEVARDYLIYLLDLNNESDEINSIAVGEYGSGPDINWLSQKIVWPGDDIWTGDESPGPGWVRQIDNWYEFSETIDDTFLILFGTITFSAEVEFSSLLDLDIDNNEFYLTITPEE